jgi:hypothetical protein
VPVQAKRPAMLLLSLLLLNSRLLFQLDALLRSVSIPLDNLPVAAGVILRCIFFFYQHDRNV